MARPARTPVPAASPIAMAPSPAPVPAPAPAEGPATPATADEVAADEEHDDLVKVRQLTIEASAAGVFHPGATRHLPADDPRIVAGAVELI